MTIKFFQKLKCWVFSGCVYGEEKEIEQGYKLKQCVHCGRKYAYIPGAIGHYPPFPLPLPKARR